MATETNIDSRVLDLDDALSAQELATSCNTELAWVVSLVEVGVVRTGNPEAPVEHWRFGSLDVRRARDASRLQRDFDANLDTAALILDLQDEVQRLRGMLRLLQHH